VAAHDEPATYPRRGGASIGDDSVRVAVDAAGIGAWDWHIATGRSAWTSQTYALFGLDPDAFVPSHDAFLERVYEPDRLAVLAWIAQALRDGRRTVLEFRIEAGGGIVRWVRSTGRAIADEQGRAIRMAGVVQDITEEKEGRADEAPESPPMAGAFCARQVAHILGLSEASVKRLASGGALSFLQSSRKNSRRFAPQEIVDYLRRYAAPAPDFEARVRAGDLDGCVLEVLEALLGGDPLETILDGRIGPVAAFARPEFLSELLARVPFMLPDRPRAVSPALMARMSVARPGEEDLIACLLRAHGYEVLRPAGNPDPVQLAEVADRVRARAVVLCAVSGAALSRVIAAAETLASRCSAAILVASGDAAQPIGAARRFGSMRALATQLKRLADGAEPRRAQGRAG
jgi:PAS domain S-box-containing protein